jgi:hypothetical protein
MGYWRYTLTEQRRALEELRVLNDQMAEKLSQREAMIGRLSRSQRIAHVQVIDQQPADDGTIATTSVDFIELDDAGSEIARQSITVPGDVLFVDAWTVKFDASLVAEGDPLRGKSLVLLRRIYSDRMPPQDGIALDVPGAIPPGYSVGEVGAFERQLWNSFWELAGDPDIAAEMGVRVAQGEAVYKPVRQGQTYELIADAIGGLSLRPLGATALTAR